MNKVKRGWRIATAVVSFFEKPGAGLFCLNGLVLLIFELETYLCRHVSYAEDQEQRLLHHDVEGSLLDQNFLVISYLFENV